MTTASEAGHTQNKPTAPSRKTETYTHQLDGYSPGGLKSGIALNLFALEIWFAEKTRWSNDLSELDVNHDTGVVTVTRTLW